MRSDDDARRELREALFLVKPGIKMSRSGLAENKHLRNVEMVRGGVTLTSNLTIDVSGLDAQQREVVCLLVSLGSTFVERIGAKRRRGSGRVTLSLQGDAPEFSPHLSQRA